MLWSTFIPLATNMPVLFFVMCWFSASKRYSTVAFTKNSIYHLPFRSESVHCLLSHDHACGTTNVSHFWSLLALCDSGTGHVATLHQMVVAHHYRYSCCKTGDAKESFVDVVQGWFSIAFESSGFDLCQKHLWYPWHLFKKELCLLLFIVRTTNLDFFLSWCCDFYPPPLPDAFFGFQQRASN